MALMSVAGHPNNEDFLPPFWEAVGLLASIAPEDASFQAAREELATCSLFSQLLKNFEERSKVAIPGVPINPYYNLTHMEAFFSAMDERSPLHTQAKLVSARGIESDLPPHGFLLAFAEHEDS
jgi:hypothetical protein